MATTTPVKILCKARCAPKSEFKMRPVPATILEPGLFALHRPLDDIEIDGTVRLQARNWVLTHLPTGNAIIRNIPNQKVAKAIVAAMLNKGIDWHAFSRVDTVPVDMRRRAKEVVDALREVHHLEP